MQYNVSNISQSFSIDYAALDLIKCHIKVYSYSFPHAVECVLRCDLQILIARLVIWPPMQRKFSNFGLINI